MSVQVITELFGGINSVLGLSSEKVFYSHLEKEKDLPKKKAVS